MKLPLVCAALALATGCASSDDRKDNDVTLASAEPHFAAHEGRPTEHRVGHSKSGSTDDDDDPWWSSILGDFFGGFLRRPLLKAERRPGSGEQTPRPVPALVARLGLALSRLTRQPPEHSDRSQG